MARYEHLSIYKAVFDLTVKFSKKNLAKDRLLAYTGHGKGVARLYGEKNNTRKRRELYGGHISQKTHDEYHTGAAGG